jgi:hypothetical protein
VLQEKIRNEIKKIKKFPIKMALSVLIYRLIGYIPGFEPDIVVFMGQPG